MRIVTNRRIDKHFAEGTLMPYLVNWLIFTLAPQQAPWFLRWILSPVMNALKQMLVTPNITNAANMVMWYAKLYEYKTNSSPRLKNTFPSRLPGGLQTAPNRLLLTS
jgi:hypothetical protein